MIDLRRDIETEEIAAQKASAISTLLCNDIPCPVTTEYQDYAISTALSSAIQSFKDLDAEQQEAISHSFTLSGNVELSDVTSYQTQNPNYSYTLLDPYGGKSTDTIKIWGNYIDDTLKEIDGDVTRRKHNIIPLDFANLMMVVASLSSMVTLLQSDLALIPSYQARSNEYKGANAKQKRIDLLRQDPVLFVWFAVQYLLGGDPKKEDVAKALYSALRCGLLHNMTIGQVFGNRPNGNSYTITLGSKNPDESCGRWYEENGCGSKKYTFFFHEFYPLINGLVQKLFATGSTDASVIRFQSDARKILNGHVPVKLLKAELKKQVQGASLAGENENV